MDDQQLLHSILDELKIMNRREDSPQTWRRRYRSTRAAVFWGIILALLASTVALVALVFALGLRSELQRFTADSRAASPAPAISLSPEQQREFQEEQRKRLEWEKAQRPPQR